MGLPDSSHDADTMAGSSCESEKDMGQKTTDAMV